MLTTGPKAQELASSFVTAALQGAVYTDSIFYRLEKLPREQIAKLDKEFLPLYQQRHGADSSHDNSLKINEQAIKTAYNFGMYWSRDAVSSVVVPSLLGHLESAEPTSPTLKTVLERLQRNALTAICQLAPLLEVSQADDVFTTLHRHLDQCKETPVSSWLALAQFEKLFSAAQHDPLGSSDAIDTAIPLIISAATQTVQTLADSLSEPAGIGRGTFVQYAWLAHQASLALVELSGILPAHIGRDEVTRDVTQLLNYSEFILSILSNPAWMNRMEFNSHRACKQAATAIRVALAALSTNSDQVKNELRQLDLRMDEADDPFGSLVLKAQFQILDQSDALYILDRVVSTLDSLVPESRCGPEVLPAASILAASWIYGIEQEGLPARALQGRCKPEIQSFLYRTVHGHTKM